MFGGGGGGGSFKDPGDLFKEMFGDKDPFSDFGKFFDNVEETTTGVSDDELDAAQAKLGAAVSQFYLAVGEEKKADIKTVMDVLDSKKWRGKEKKLLKELKKKYPKNAMSKPLLKKLEAAFEAFEEAMGIDDDEHQGG